MINFLEETRAVLNDHGKTFDDIIFVGNTYTHTRMSVERFIANSDFEYDDYYGDNKQLNICLILVGIDFWLKREVFNDNGAERWEYKPVPNI